MIQRIKLNLGELRISKVSAQIHLLCKQALNKSLSCPWRYWVLSQEQAGSLNGHGWKGLLELTGSHPLLPSRLTQALLCKWLWIISLGQALQSCSRFQCCYPHSKTVFPDDQSVSVCACCLWGCQCVCLGVLCALSRDRLLWQGWATGSSAHQVQQGAEHSSPEQQKKALANLIWALLLSLGFKGTLYTNTLTISST